MTLSFARAQAVQAAHARRFRPLPTIKDKAAAKPVIDSVAAQVAAQLKQTRSALGMTTTNDDVEYFKQRMAENRLDLAAPNSLRLDPTGAPSPTKALRNQSPLSAANPDTVKKRNARDLIVDLVSWVIAAATFPTKAVKRDLTGAPSPTKAVRNQPYFPAKRVK